MQPPLFGGEGPERKELSFCEVVEQRSNDRTFVAILFPFFLFFSLLFSVLFFNIWETVAAMQEDASIHGQDSSCLCSFLLSFACFVNQATINLERTSARYLRVIAGEDIFRNYRERPITSGKKIISARV